MADELTGKKAFELYEKGRTQGQIAELYDSTQPTVSRLIKSYKEGRETGEEAGRESVSPDSFEADELKDALRDRMSDEDQYQCGECGTGIDYLEAECSCGARPNWSGI